MKTKQTVSGLFQRLVMFVRYYRAPTCVVMKGARVDGRFIAHLGVNAEYSIDDYGNRLVKFSNRNYEYYASNIHVKIWNKRQLIFWRRLLGADIKCIHKVRGEYKRVRA